MLWLFQAILSIKCHGSEPITIPIGGITRDIECKKVHCQVLLLSNAIRDGQESGKCDNNCHGP
jgi:hypothetical protein